MNWNLFIKLLLPIRLRLVLLLIALLEALTKVTRSKYDSDLSWVQNLIIDLKYTSQVQAMVLLLNDKFDPISRTIVIVDGTDGNVTLYSNDNLSYIKIAGESTNVVVARNEENCTVGTDFIVKVPLYVNKDIVRLFVKRYVFAGVEFMVINL